jgi:hypothetical protein
MRRFLLFIVLLTGCETVELDHKWWPLENVTEFNLPIVPDDAITTIGTTLYTTDLMRFLSADPVIMEGQLLHEQVHARRQYGQLTWWLLRYLFDTDFARAEEEIGWAKELRFEAAHGYPLTPNRINWAVEVLVKYQVIGGRVWTRHFLEGLR